MKITIKLVDGSRVVSDGMTDDDLDQLRNSLSKNESVEILNTVYFVPAFNSEHRPQSGHKKKKIILFPGSILFIEITE